MLREALTNVGIAAVDRGVIILEREIKQYAVKKFNRNSQAPKQPETATKLVDPLLLDLDYSTDIRLIELAIANEAAKTGEHL